MSMGSFGIKGFDMVENLGVAVEKVVRSSEHGMIGAVVTVLVIAAGGAFAAGAFWVGINGRVAAIESQMKAFKVVQYTAKDAEMDQMKVNQRLMAMDHKLNVLINGK